MKCRQIMEMLEQLSPLSFASGWDNVGLLIGDEEREIHKILVCVDVTDEVIEQAVHRGADMILSHHPLIFKGIKKINGKDYVGRRVLRLAEQKICYYACHTNFDVMGMADAAADELSLRGCEVLQITYEDEIAKEGFGRIGELENEMTLLACAEYVKQVFGIEAVKVFGNLDESVKRVAISPGSGKSMIEDAIAADVDVLITGDIDHHDGLDATLRGLSIIDAGHFGIEKIFIPFMEQYLRRRMHEVEVIRARQGCPFEIV
ncbi:MAG: Nif3-like dinuclear metal center hexameric protein [Lachnospiraceae bacterium]|nr:Nif3-like dinuclear metal center hexameric protein [Lachnospiraceae bacterium]